MNNLNVALHVEPSNADVEAKASWCRQQRAKTPPEPTLPSTIGDEKKFNPFMRVVEAPVQQHAGKNDAVETMAAIRAEKDNFKG